MENLPVIYKPYKIYLHITPSGNIYIGQTKDEPKIRFGSNGSNYKTQPFYRAVKKYGWSNIQHIILFDNLDSDYANQFEIGLIESFSKYCKLYNAKKGGDGGGTHSEESKRKMSIAKKGKRVSIATEFKKGHNKGIPMPMETRRKISEKHKHIFHSEASKLKISQAQEYKKKPILQYTLDDVFVKRWSCVREIERVLGIRYDNIQHCCSHKYNRKTAYGYKWKYESELIDNSGQYSLF